MYIYILEANDGDVNTAMATLGDKQARWEWAEGQLKPGRIVFLSTADADHDKFLIIAATAPCLLGFYINSNIHEMHQRTGLAVFHVPIAGKDHSRYLTKEVSYANCMEVVTRVSRRNALTQIVASNGACLKGKITTEERTLIVAAVRAAPTINEAHRRLVLASL